MQVVENWAELHGSVVDVLARDGEADQEVRVLVESVDSLVGWPNLLAGLDAGDVVDVRWPSAAGEVPPFRNGSSITWRVRVAGPGKVVGHPTEFSFGRVTVRIPLAYIVTARLGSCIDDDMWFG